jgi:hypothetical protein
VLLEGLGQLKNPMTSSGIESATFRLEASLFKKMNVEILLRKQDGLDWIQVAQYRDQWRALVNTVMNIQVP